MLLGNLHALISCFTDNTSHLFQYCKTILYSCDVLSGTLYTTVAELKVTSPICTVCLQLCNHGIQAMSDTMLRLKAHETHKSRIICFCALIFLSAVSVSVCLLEDLVSLIKLKVPFDSGLGVLTLENCNRPQSDPPYCM